MTKREELGALADRLENFQRVLESARVGSNKTISVWSDDPVIVAESVAALRAQASAAPPEREAVTLRKALGRIPSDLFWLIGKGRLSPKEPLYAAQIKNGLDTISEAESDDLATAINLACDKAALSSRDDGEADKRTAPASCPNCYNESDCSNVDICNAVEGVYRPSEAPSTIAADVLALLAAKRIMLVCQSCENNNPEGCGHFTADTLRLARDGSFVCENCWDDLGDETRWVDLPAISRIDVPAKADAGEIDVPGKTAVKVKPLEWSGRNIDGSIHIAYDGPLQYWAWELAGYGYWSWGALAGREIPGGIEAAKAAAQADYETRIKSALDIEAQGVAVSVEELVSFIKDKAYTTFDDWEDDFARALLDKYSIRSALMTEGGARP